MNKKLAIGLLLAVCIFAGGFYVEQNVKRAVTAAPSRAIPVEPIENAVRTDVADPLAKLMNSSFKLGGEYLSNVTLKNGEYDFPIYYGKGSAIDSVPDGSGYVKLGKAAFGDITGDGVEDAVAVLNKNLGGNGVYVSIAFFKGSNGGFSLLKEVDIEDRADIRDIGIENGTVTVRYGFAHDNSGMSGTDSDVVQTFAYSADTNDIEATSEKVASPFIESVSPGKARVGDTIDLIGFNFAGFEGDLGAWIEAGNGEKAYMPGESTYSNGLYKQIVPGKEVIKVKLDAKLCETNESYRGAPCEKFLDIVPGTYKVYTNPWGKISNKVSLEVIK